MGKIERYFTIWDIREFLDKYGFKHSVNEDITYTELMSDDCVVYWKNYVRKNISGLSDKEKAIHNYIIEKSKLWT